MSVSIYVIAAICGNFWCEGGINSGIYESLKVTPDTAVYSHNTGGFGLGQWTNTGGNPYGRRYKLAQYLKENNYSHDSFKGQIEYLFHEKAWHTLGKNQKQFASEFPNFESFINSDRKDVRYLAKVFLCCWEGILNNTLELRQDAAERCLSYIREHKDDSKKWKNVAGNRFLSVNERLNNAVCFYLVVKGLKNVGDGGDEPPEPEPPTENDFLYWFLLDWIEKGFLR